MRGRTALLISVALSAGVTAVVAGVAKPSEVKGQSAAFSALRVCGSTNFSRRENRCTHDQRKHAITSNRITCSTTLTATHPGVWHVRFAFDHHVDPWRRGGTVSVGVNRLWHNTNVGTNMPVPGGNWRCDFAYGSVVTSVAFRSGGPRGQIVDTAVCSDSDVLRFGVNRAGKRCARDDSGTPFVGARHIYCSVVFSHPSSQQAKIDVLGPDGTSVSSTNVIIGRPTISEAAATLDASALTTPGTYSCRFSLEGGATVTKQFQVASTS
jgi:hypothetical protein